VFRNYLTAEYKFIIAHVISVGFSFAMIKHGIFGKEFSESLFRLQTGNDSDNMLFFDDSGNIKKSQVKQ